MIHHLAKTAPLALAAGLLAAVPEARAQVYQISMPLGGTAGTFYTQGAALADFINQNTDSLRVIPSTSGGSVENIRLVGSGQAEIGMAFPGDIYNAWSGEGFEQPYTEYRQLGPAAKTSGWNFVVLDSSAVETVEDLAGRDFVPGAPGSGSAAGADLFLETAGLRDDIDIAYHSWGELAQMLTDGDIDGFNRTGGVPVAFAQQIDATHPIKILDLGPKMEESDFLEKYPYFTEVEIPAGTYRGQDQNATTFGQSVQWVVHKDVPDEVVREFLELAYSDEAAEHLDQLIPDHDHRNDDWMRQLYVPLHPAAAEFWAERGVTAPEPMQQ